MATDTLFIYKGYLKMVECALVYYSRHAGERDISVSLTRYHCSVFSGWSK